LIPAMVDPGVVFAGGETLGSINSDPIWCPEGVTPRSRKSGCSPSFTTLTGLLTWLRTNDPNRAGVIWIEKTYDSASEGVGGFVLDGADYINLDNHALTIQGGWERPGTTSVDHNDRSVFTDDFLHIDHWNNNITINDVLVDRPSSVGLLVNTLGEIHLSNVDSQFSTGDAGNAPGAILNNFSRTGTWSVTVNDSSFNDNRGNGLLVISSGEIITHNLTANGNGFSEGGHPGVMLDNRYGVSAQNITITGASMFNDNRTWGLIIYSQGVIEVHDVIANGSGTGVYLDNTSALTPQPVSVIGSAHIFNINSGSGLIVNSHGTIYAENLSAIGNGQWGAILNNSRGSGGITLTGGNFNSFYDNGYRGFSAFSYDRITISNISVDNNGSHGVVLGTPDSASVTCAKIYNNMEYGLHASDVLGSLVLDDVTLFNNASGNYLYAGVPAVTRGGCL
jgi:hypothetical protein